MLRYLTIAVFVCASLSCNKTIDEIFGTGNDRPVGASANELLSGGKYHSLKVEILYMPGFEPDAGALSHLHSFLTARLNKPGSVTITQRQIPASSSTVLNGDDVHAIEKAHRTGSNTSTEINVSIIYTNGEYTNTNVLGIAYRNTSAALFGKKIRDNSGGFGQASRTKLEATVLEHEFGHLLGLVDLGTDMTTPHKANGSHCDNQNCLMFHAAETTDILGLLITGSVPSLDANCINDLKANGGK